jgi:copper chaperone
MTPQETRHGAVGGLASRLNSSMKETAMVTETISVPEIHCDNCKTSIEGALASIGGVAGASVDIPARTVTVTYDDASVDRGDLVEAIEQQGYEVPAG